MKSFILKSKTWIFAHRKTSIVLVLVLVGLSYGLFQIFNKNEGETRYVLGTVERKAIISSISGTGQVSASNQVTINAKTSGNITSVNVKAGQKVKTGATIASVDATEALFQLESARISYEELTTIDDRDIRNAKESISDAEIELKEAQHKIRSTLIMMISDMSDTMSELEKQLNNRDGYLNHSSRFDLSKQSKEYIYRAENAWWDAKRPLDDLFVSNSTTDETIENMLLEANDVATLVSQAVKYARDAVVYLRDREENHNIDKANSAYTTVTELVATANNIISNGISGRNSLTNANRSLRNAQNAYSDLLAGPETLTLRSEQLSLRQREQAYADHFIRAPFAGTIASVSVRRGETVGSSSAIATLITDQKIAEITLNEIDIVKVNVGQKATLTFDAVEDLTITGEVVEVDLTGTVSQGVVSYRVKIAFDTEDSRIRSGMTSTANIITEMKQDVLAIPLSAVKTQGGISYVEIVLGNIIPAQVAGTSGVLLSNSPTRVEVETGISNDESIEIISGLALGDQYITRTITISASTQSAPSSSAPSIFGGGAIRTGGGGGGNFPR